MAKGTPVCTECVVSTSVGGKVQVIKFDYTADFHYSITRKYAVPDGWKESDVDDFQQDRLIELRGRLEGIAQAELDELLEEKSQHG